MGGRTEPTFGEIRTGTRNGARKRIEKDFLRKADLLDALLLGVPPDQRIENGKDVPAVFDHAVEDVAELGVAFGVAVPLQQDGLGHFDIAAQLFRRMAAQEQAIEKRRFPLGKREVCGDFCRNDLGNRGHKKNAVYRKASPRQVVQAVRCCVAGKASTGD